MTTSFNGGRSRSTRREAPTMGKPLVNFITSHYESSAPFLLLALRFSLSFTYLYCRMFYCFW